MGACVSRLLRGGGEVQFRVKLIHPGARLPVRATDGAAGYDIAAAVATLVPARGKERVLTGLEMALPRGVYGRVAPRSGLAWKCHIDVGGGVIDSDYRGEVGVILFNHSNDDLKIEVGDKVAQLILEKHLIAPVIQVSELSSTTRGAGGFGSTGMQATAPKGGNKSRSHKIFLTAAFLSASCVPVILYVFFRHVVAAVQY